MKNVNPEDISHWNVWFTNRLLESMTKYPNVILESLFKPYATFSKMSDFYGLSKTYLQDKRKSRWSKTAIPLDQLEKMVDSTKHKLNQWKKLHSNFSKELINIKKEMIDLIRFYKTSFNPKRTSFSWLRKYHPNLDFNYFTNIKTLQQAYWLGYLIADGWLTLIRKPHGEYYRIGFSQGQKDNERVFSFVRDLGLNKKYIRNKLIECSLIKSRKRTLSTLITFYSGNVGDKKTMANDLINLGMRYEYDTKKGMRKKVPYLVNLGDYNLMLAYILGFYDGDGTLAYNKKDGRISPSIFSSNRKFLEQIRQYFDISKKPQKSIIHCYDYKRNIDLEGDIYKLPLGNRLFHQMMSIEVVSLKRKRVDPDLLFKRRLSNQKKWLAEKFTKEEFDSLLDVISPTKLSEILGIHRSTIVSFAKMVYNIEVPNGSYYKQLATYLQHQGKDVPFFPSFMFWIKHLEKIGKYSSL